MDRQHVVLTEDRQKGVVAIEPGQRELSPFLVAVGLVLYAHRGMAVLQFQRSRSVDQLDPPIHDQRYPVAQLIRHRHIVRRQKDRLARVLLR
ncbi:MAG TPA: hypothetical protein VLA19_15820, partial [Herpetosiphonaceae bacterium]|nr:hypothetical protein [Herpetosiphonaceae bacterium]